MISDQTTRSTSQSQETRLTTSRSSAAPMIISGSGPTLWKRKKLKCLKWLQTLWTIRGVACLNHRLYRGLRILCCRSLRALLRKTSSRWRLSLIKWFRKRTLLTQSSSSPTPMDRWKSTKAGTRSWKESSKLRPLQIKSKSDKATIDTTAQKWLWSASLFRSMQIMNSRSTDRTILSSQSEISRETTW